MFDAAGRLLIFSVEAGQEIGRQELALPEAEVPKRAQMVADLGVNVLICGAVSQVLEGLLVQRGVAVIPHVCGDVEEVLRCYLAGESLQDRFEMPGCCGRRRRGSGRGCCERNRRWQGQGG